MCSSTWVMERGSVRERLAWLRSRAAAQFISYRGDHMSRYATVNLQDVENSVGDRAPGVEGRFARKHLDSRDLGVSLFRYAPNLRSPMAHSHREQEEAYVVAAGSGRVLLDDEVV